MKKITLAIILLFLLAGALHHHIYHKFPVKGSLFTQMMYLPSGKYLKPASFGYYGLLADFIYIWSIQYYSDPVFHPHIEYLKHTYDIITELDPQYLDAYQTGALFMFYEGRNPEAGLKLLDKGLQKNPKEWILPTDAGFYCMMILKDKHQAAEYFQKADNIPGAPTLVKRMRAGLNFQMGQTLYALELWKEVYKTAERPSIKQTAFQHVHDLQVLLDLESLRNAIEIYQHQYHQLPLHLQQLVSAGILNAVPIDPESDPYQYDPRTGKVKYAKDLVIYKRYQEG